MSQGQELQPWKRAAQHQSGPSCVYVQKMLPRARVVYCSATGVSNVKNMAYMEGLGLWGEGLSFPNFESFLESVTRRGLGAAEMLAMEMKSAGVYVSRGLSYKQAEFVTREVTLSPSQTSTYDAAAHVWNELRNPCSSFIVVWCSSTQRCGHRSGTAAGTVRFSSCQCM
ncbi:Protein strawberry notch homolog [Geodia barretti]|uniref:Protein strawberry notch homolog n=1 Tax=Geodia barretti TaxID=519541 RepID=A0AA35XIL3_GEOBA|nr:Protein strawberry notch homolog [Geodia barretti]